MSDTWDAEDRAIARALDAASDAETQGADEQLVDAYRDVLAEMPVSEVTPPIGLEDRIVAAALDRRPPAAPTLDRARARRRSRLRVFALGAATVAAAVVIGFIVRGGTSGSPTPGGHVTLATMQHADIDALLRSPGVRTGRFGAALGRVAIARDGNAAIYDVTSADPAPLSIGLVSSGGTIFMGPAHPTGGAIAFVVDHPERVTAVVLQRDGAEIGRAELKPS